MTAPGKNGFTLIEAITALAITLMAITLAIGGYLALQKEQLRQIAQDTADTDIRIEAGRIQKEMRLSSLSEMVFYPDSEPQRTAVSFPIRSSGTFATNSQGTIEWDTTIIYHLSSDGKRLLRTVFNPRDNSLTLPDRQKQLAKVVADGNGNGAANGNNASTTCLLKHLSEWKIIPQGNTYDGYANVNKPKLDDEANLGSFILTPGNHTLKLTVTGKSVQSSGYALGLDTLHLSPSTLEREAEAQQASGSPTPRVEYESGTWGGHHQLTFPATKVDDAMEISFYNDRWEDTNFELIGCVKSNTTIGTLDFNYNPPDLALRLEGNTTNWSATSQTGDITGKGTNDVFAGSIVRTLLTGIELDGMRCKVAFSAGYTNALEIEEAYIDECQVITNATRFITTANTIGLPVQITFDNGSSTSCTVPCGETPLFSDFLDYPIEKGKSYAVTFRIASAPGYAGPRIWRETTTATTSAFAIPAAAALPGDPILANWDGKSGKIALPRMVVGVAKLYSTYPAEGTYTSPAVDTHMKNPTDASIDWTEDLPSETRMEIRVRSGSNPDMSDAPEWSSLPNISWPGPISASYERYLQYRITMFASSDGLKTPKLRDIAIQWPGKTALVDVGGTFVNASDYGQFEGTIDGQPLVSPLRVSVAAQETVRGPNHSLKTLESKCNFELTPRNK